MENLSGIWYNRQMNGTGFAILDFKDGIVLYWYNYSDGFPFLDAGGQMWFICQQKEGSRNEFLVYRPEGSWQSASRDYELGEPVGELTLTEDGDRLLVAYRFTNLGPCKPVMVSPRWHGCSSEFAIERLTPAL